MSRASQDNRADLFWLGSYCGFKIYVKSSFVAYKRYSWHEVSPANPAIARLM